MKKLFASLALAGLFVIPTITRAQFASSVVAYTEGSGVSPGYNNPTAALGAPSQVTPGEYGGPVDPFDAPYLDDQIVGLGTSGGSITLQFTTPIQNNPSNPFGLDFIIFGHAGFNIVNGDYSGGGITDGSFYTGGTSDVRVSVSADGTTFYTLHPTVPPGVDGLFPTDGSGNPLLPVNPALTAADFAGQDLNGIRALYDGSAGGAGFSLAWAIDGNNQSVSLSSVDYVRLDVLNDGTPVYIDAISVVPEPATWTLAMAGAGLFLLRRHIRNMRVLLLFWWGLVAASVGGAATIDENFSSNPQQNGWQIFGDPNLFQWDATNENLDVTWDSSQTNSYFYHSLGTIVAKSDDFSLSFDLQLSDIAIGVNPSKSDAFELVVGFINLVSATSTNLERGAGINATHGAHNTCEFDYFPDSGYGATISPTLISSNNQFATKFAFPLTIDPGALFHVTMAYTASNLTLQTTVTRNGQPFGTIPNVVLGGSFKDFRLDQVAVCSYSDAGADGSLLAHGTVDNFVVTVPPPPVQNLSGNFTCGVWQAQFLGQSNWLYTMQRSVDFQSWTNISSIKPGNATNLFLQDAGPPVDKAFYRISAQRP
jgi:hypothetical protein